MNQHNCKIIQAAVKEAGDFLNGKLPMHPYLHKRNPWAHLWERIKTQMGKSYKECDDLQLDEILNIVAHCRDNPC